MTFPFATDELAGYRSDIQSLFDKTLQVQRSYGDVVSAIGTQTPLTSPARVSDNMGGSAGVIGGGGEIAASQQWVDVGSYPCMLGTAETVESKTTILDQGGALVAISHFLLTTVYTADIRERDQCLIDGTLYVVEDSDSGDSYALAVNAHLRRVR